MSREEKEAINETQIFYPQITLIAQILFVAIRKNLRHLRMDFYLRSICVSSVVKNPRRDS
ncbi:MAG: hypothetical protein ACREC8_05330 [Limisphaerales bacterium]